jgi:hypothetical protein
VNLNFLFILKVMTGHFYKHQTSVNGRFVKVKFTPAEDAALVQLVEAFGTADWKKIALHMETRNARQCREREKNYLDPSLDQGAWTHSEDVLLMQQFREHGSKWNTIAQVFTNRSDLSLRNRWQMLERQMAKTGETTPKPSENIIPTPVPVEAIAKVVRPVSPFGLTNPFDLFGLRS